MADGEGQARFSGYAVVEIMGHQQTAGWVSTEYFGGVAMLHVVMPGEAGQEITLDARQWTGNEMLEAGSVIRMNRLPVDEWIGAQSIYRLRPVAEDVARSRQPTTIDVLVRAPKPALQPAGAGGEDYERLDDDSEDDD